MKFKKEKIVTSHLKKIKKNNLKIKSELFVGVGVFKMLCFLSLLSKVKYKVLAGFPEMKTPILQRHNMENCKQIFPEKELSVLSSNFYIHASVSDLHIPTICLSILLQENTVCEPIL
jgi:hypothetical protein